MSARLPKIDFVDIRDLRKEIEPFAVCDTDESPYHFEPLLYNREKSSQSTIEYISLRVFKSS